MITATSTSLLEGLKSGGNDRVWHDFCARYQPILLAFGRRLGLGEHDAQDAAQDTLLTFAKAYRDGKYDRDRGRLHTWLFVIARTRILDAHRRAVRDRAAGHDPDETETVNRLADDRTAEQLWETEWQQAVIRQCLEEIRREIEPKTMRAFELFALEGRSAADTASQLGTSTNSVFLAKSRILSRLRELRGKMEDIW